MLDDTFATKQPSKVSSLSLWRYRLLLAMTQCENPCVGATAMKSDTRLDKGWREDWLESLHSVCGYKAHDCGWHSGSETENSCLQGYSLYARALLQGSESCSNLPEQHEQRSLCLPNR